MISIIIPVYNVEKYLKDCLNSILNQSFYDIEIILVDDGSTDSSGKICDDYALKDSRIRVFHKENGGVSIARNLGLDKALGDWVMFVDADDFLLQNSIVTLFQAANRDNSDIVFGNAKRLVGDHHYTIFNLKNSKTNEILHSLPSLTLWGYLMKRKPLVDNSIRFVDGLAYSEDAVFLDEATIFYKQLSIIDDFVYVYRDNPFSVCKSTQYERKIRHQFWAASLICNLNKKYKIKYPKESMIIYKDGLSKIRAGIEVAITSDLQNKFCFTKCLFNEYFSKEYNSFFVYNYFKLFLINNIKKTIKKLMKLM